MENTEQQVYHHSVTLDKDACKGCINCIKRCPTEAIRVRDGKAHILPKKCIDCAECIRVCPHHAKLALYDPMSVMDNFKYKIALPAPSLYAQFNNLEEPDAVINAFLKIGFDEVYEVAKAAELVSDATRKMMSTSKFTKPAISSACPAVLKLIRVRFPQLIDHVLPIVAPMEAAARLAKDIAVENTDYERHEIGCFFITPCPAKVTATKTPIGSEKSEVDGALAVKEIYPKLLSAMKDIDTPQKMSESGRIGVAWAGSGGESAGLISTESYLAADGIENVIKVLEDLEDEKYHDIDFVELNSCPGGCVGGILQVENPYIARNKLKKISRLMPVSKNHIDGAMPTQLLWDTDLTYVPVMELGTTRKERFMKYAQMQEILEDLPGLDCGSCGAPTCATMAEDIVRGTASIDDCTVLMRQKMEAVLKALGK